MRINDWAPRRWPILLERCALLGGVVFCASALISAPALAQDTAPQAPGTIDAGKGPIAGSTRFIGLGGAFVAIADDTEGVAINPASSAVRLPYSWSAWDYGFGIDFSIGAWLPKNDFYNQSGTAQNSTSTALFGSVGGDVYYRHLGLGVAAEAERNAATRQDQVQGVSRNFAANFGLVHASLAYGFFDGQLLLGLGPRVVGLSFDRQSSGGILSSAGMGYEAGVIVKPQTAQYRAGVAVKSPIDAKLPTEPGVPTSTVHVPWQVALGFAYQFGRPPLNPPLVVAADLARKNVNGREPTPSEIQATEDSLFESYEARERFYLLVSTELSLIQGGGDNTALTQFGTETGPPTIGGAIVSPRLGLESEVIPHYLKLRAGSYYEQPLVDGARFRVHGTGGLDVRLFRWNVFGLIHRFDIWQLSLAADAARSYLNTAVSIGFWH
jgi:hypothetical protein